MQRMTPTAAVLTGGALVGTIDALDAIVFSMLRSGTPPARVFQGIAFGLLGRPTYQYGWRSVALGLAVHYLIAFTIVGVYVAASRFVPLLTRRPLVCGTAYGVAAYGFMNRVVIPLSKIGPQRFVLAPFANGILIHIVGIGIPAALLAAAVSKSRSQPTEP